MEPTFILLIAAILFILLIVLIYNNLIRKKNEIQNAFGSLDAQLKKRYDLIPNLVSTVKEYAAHEKEILTKVTDLRSQAISGDKLSSEKKVKIDNEISGNLRQLMISVENYPDLKANVNFIQLQRSLNEIESQISAARRTFNATVTDYNNSIQVFPGNIIASAMSLRAQEVFSITEKERENVKVDQLFK